MRNGITLHPKYGVNPTICTCFWCGGDKNELALLGYSSKRITGKDEAPRNTVMDYEPCDKCKENMSLGITLMEASTTSKRGQPEIQYGVYPTGKWWVLKEEACKRFMSDEMYAAALHHKKAFIDQELAQKLGLYETFTDE